jgi:hypothetical protein
MKKQNIPKEFHRMIKLAGINEIKITQPNNRVDQIVRKLGLDDSYLTSFLDVYKLSPEEFQYELLDNDFLIHDLAYYIYKKTHPDFEGDYRQYLDAVRGEGGGISDFERLGLKLARYVLINYGIKHNLLNMVDGEYSSDYKEMLDASANYIKDHYLILNI